MNTKKATTIASRAGQFCIFPAMIFFLVVVLVLLFPSRAEALAPGSCSGYTATVYDPNTTGADNGHNMWTDPEVNPVGTFPYVEFQNTSQHLSVDVFWASPAHVTNGTFDDAGYTGTTLASNDWDWAVKFQRTITADEAGPYSIVLNEADDHVWIYVNGVLLYSLQDAWVSLGGGPITISASHTFNAGDVVDILVAEETSHTNELNLAITPLFTSACDQDYSDAPADGEIAPNIVDTTSYGIARHAIDAAIRLGSTNNGDANDIADTNASSDANDDGVTIPSLTQGQSETITIDVSQASANDGYLQGWIDWNGDGDFADTGEQIATDLQYSSGTTGTISVPVVVPATAITSADTFARFRWSSDSGLAASGFATDGEVEDYQITINTDLTALASCSGYRAVVYDPNTTLTDTGYDMWGGVAETNPIGVFPYVEFENTAQHMSINTRWTFASYITDGTNDDTGYTGSTLDNNDWDRAIAFERTITADEAGAYSLILDYADDHVKIYVNGTEIYAQQNAYGITLPHTIASSYTFNAGDVLKVVSIEEHRTNTRLELRVTPLFASVCGQDYSDAPANGGTAPDGINTTSYGEATHSISNDIYIGVNSPDSDTGSQPTVKATGDDNHNTDDEDGITFSALTINNTSYSIDADVSNLTGNPATLHAWIDFDGNGAFDTDEHSSVNVPDGSFASIVSLSWTGLTGLDQIDTYARFRLTTDTSVTGSTPTGSASDGEVSDYAITIMPEKSFTTGRTPQSCSAGIGGVYATWTETGTESGTGVFTPGANQSASNPSFTWAVTGQVVSASVDPAENFDDGTQLEALYAQADSASNLNIRVLTNGNDDGDPIVSMTTTTITFNSPTRANDFAFAVLDIDGDQIRFRAKDASGVDVPVATVASWLVETYETNAADAGVNYVWWDAANAALVGDGMNDPQQVTWHTHSHPRGGSDDEAPGGWFQPDIALSELTVEFTSLGNSNQPSHHLYLASCLEPGKDYGDAPVSGTAPDGSSTNNYGEASHSVVSGIHMGTTAPDIDSSYQGSAVAGDGSTGDDGDGTDDEDGVTLPAGITQGITTTIDVDVTQPAAGDGYLQGWIDWNGDGDFDDNGERVATNLQYTTGTTGTISVSVTPPAAITSAATFARFRWSTDVSLDSTTSASDGEVEDYQLPIITAAAVPPFSCEPAFYQTINPDGSPRTFRELDAATATYSVIANSTPMSIAYNHVDNIVYGIAANGDMYAIGSDGSEVLLGTTSRDTDSTPLQNYNAMSIGRDGYAWVHTGGDDLTFWRVDLATLVATAFAMTGTPDEDKSTADYVYRHDGVSNKLYGRAGNRLYEVDLDNLTRTGTNLTGDSSNGAYGAVWSDINGAVYTFHNSSGNIYKITNPEAASPTSVRIAHTEGAKSNDGASCPKALAPFYDYGDAPVSYGTTINDNGPQHGYLTSIHLGTILNEELNGFKDGTDDSLNATDDDSDDGVSWNGATLQGQTLYRGLPGILDVDTVGSGTLYGWIDWNKDGDFNDADEALDPVVSTGGTVRISFLAPDTITDGTTYARFRYSSDPAAASPTGPASDGEVEDYQVLLDHVTSFTCSPGIYQSVDDGGRTFRELNPATAAYDIIASSTPNSIAYNSLNDIIYGITAAGHIYVTGADGSEHNLGITSKTTDGTPLDESYNAMAIDKNGDAWVHRGSDNLRFWKIDLTTLIAEPVDMTGNNDNAGTADYAYRADGSNNRLYGRADDKLYIVDLDAGTRSVKTLTGDSHNGPYGAVWADINGKVYTYNNATGNIYKISDIDAASPTSTLMATTEDIGGNDGASCPLAAAPFYDFGDAPSPYATLIADTGPQHTYVETIYLGTTLNEELNGYKEGSDDNGDATDDDSDDGVTLSGSTLQDQSLTNGQAVTIDVVTVGSGTLYGFIDWNRDGDFGDPGETLTPVPSTGGTENISVIPPNDLVGGLSIARFRYSSDAAAANPTGQANDGEVEDYQIELIAGFPVSGRVYNDINVDGVNDAGEAGISDLTVVLYDTVNDSCVSTRTDADGNYIFDGVLPGNYQLYEASGETVATPQNCGVANVRDPQGYVSTTVSVLPAFDVTNAAVTGKDFGDVKMPTFSPDNTSSILPGTNTYYAHRFSPRSSGTVSFNTSSNTPTTSGWTSTLYQDSDCNGQLDGTEGTSPLSGSLTATAGTDICLINKVYAPANVQSGESWSNVITANFDTGNGTAGTTALSVTDLTRATVSEPGAGSSNLELRKTVENLTQSSAETDTQNQARPGDVLKYRVYYSNSGDGPITELEVKDTVPEFTTLNAASIGCETTPASLTCTPDAANDPDLEWGFTGTLGAGESGSVSYEVKID